MPMTWASRTKRYVVGMDAQAATDTSTGLLLALAGGAGVVLGSLLQAVTGYLTDRRAQQREHTAWLRDQRITAYTGLLEATTVALTAIERTSEHRSRATDEFSTRFVQAYLVSKMDVRPHLNKLMEAVNGGLYRTELTNQDRHQQVADALLDFQAHLTKHMGFDEPTKPTAKRWVGRQSKNTNPTAKKNDQGVQPIAQ
jgi:hypothetical protein